jgi:hypothetical protein
MAERFVGRAEELGLLRDLLARAATGEPQVALIGGRQASASPAWPSSSPPPPVSRVAARCGVAACHSARRACHSPR